MKKHIFWDFIRQTLLRGQATMLLAVVASEKGSPGNVGFAMAVRLDDQNKPVLCGTIGGGVMELRHTEEAAQALRAHATVRTLQKLHHFAHPEKTPSGLICSGSQTIATVSLAAHDVPAVEKICEAIHTRTPLVFSLSAAGLQTQLQIHPTDRITSRFVLNNAEHEHWRYEECVGLRDTVYVIGGGHVGLAVSRQMALLDFEVITIDDRPNLATMQANSYAHQKICAPYSTLGDIVREGDYSYVVIVTTAYPSDKTALCALANKNLRYLGVMGSSTKIKKIFTEARYEGMTKEALQRVSAPIGININSDTPEEIAVSIAAEIIAVKNGAPNVSR